MDRKGYTRKTLQQVRQLVRKAMRHQQKAWVRTDSITEIVPNLDHRTVTKLVQAYSIEGKPKEITLEDVASLLHESEL